MILCLALHSDIETYVNCPNNTGAANEALSFLKLLLSSSFCNAHLEVVEIGNCVVGRSSKPVAENSNGLQLVV